MNRRHINARQRQHIANTTQQPFIKPYVSHNTETLTLENSIKQIEAKMDFLLERLDVLQYKILQMEFISTDIHSHSQQLDLLKNKVMELSKQNAISDIFKDVKYNVDKSDNEELNEESKEELDDEHEKEESDKDSNEASNEASDEASNEESNEESNKESKEESDKDSNEDSNEESNEGSNEGSNENFNGESDKESKEPNILLNLKYKILKPSAK